MSTASEKWKSDYPMLTNGAWMKLSQLGLRGSEWSVLAVVLAYTLGTLDKDKPKSAEVRHLEQREFTADWIASKCGQSTDRVDRAIRSLIARRILERPRRGTHGHPSVLRLSTNTNDWTTLPSEPQKRRASHKSNPAEIAVSNPAEIAVNEPSNPAEIQDSVTSTHCSLPLESKRSALPHPSDVPEPRANARQGTGPRSLYDLVDERIAKIKAAEAEARESKPAGAHP